MSLIEKLDEVLGLVSKAAPGEWVPHPAMDYSICLQDGSFIDITRHRAYGEVAERDAIIATLNLLRDHGPAIRQALLKADLWDKHSGSFSVLEAMLDAASPLVLNKLKAIDAARATGEGEGHD